MSKLVRPWLELPVGIHFADHSPDPCGDIRRINVEIPALSISDFRRLKAADCVGTYTLFQETYHRESYRRFHPSGPKSGINQWLSCLGQL